ncbi:hypothetical protein PFISCL1PPCAC_16286 [Pristionchus fissidentatus]|uniref:Uncharacterized protein n=1 Tax=Pristionchus fissidentatus TaxID=1538716 RepID=A0AAV5W2N6_9BILA|nr:hypothetical protein PFISCL1PPCAC_16286 [Pristionchus fissidentatus]
MMSSSLLSVLLLATSASALFEDAPLPAAAGEPQVPMDIRQKIIEVCNFPSENMTPTQYAICTRLVATYRVQLLEAAHQMQLQQEQHPEGGAVAAAEIPLAKRKASFIRFGKRSAPSVDRYEELDSVPEKRKASFIRFGRR